VEALVGVLELLGAVEVLVLAVVGAVDLMVGAVVVVADLWNLLCQ